MKVMRWPPDLDLVRADVLGDAARLRPPPRWRERMRSSSRVLPWSTWPMTVTTGGRGRRSSSRSSSSSSKYLAWSSASCSSPGSTRRIWRADLGGEQLDHVVAQRLGGGDHLALEEEEPDDVTGRAVQLGAELARRRAALDDDLEVGNRGVRRRVGGELRRLELLEVATAPPGSALGRAASSAGAAPQPGRGRTAAGATAEATATAGPTAEAATTHRGRPRPGGRRRDGRPSGSGATGAGSAAGRGAPAGARRPGGGGMGRPDVGTRRPGGRRDRAARRAHRGARAGGGRRAAEPGATAGPEIGRGARAPMRPPAGGTGRGGAARRAAGGGRRRWPGAAAAPRLAGGTARDGPLAIRCRDRGRGARRGRRRRRWPPAALVTGDRPVRLRGWSVSGAPGADDSVGGTAGAGRARARARLLLGRLLGLRRRDEGPRCRPCGGPGRLGRPRSRTSGS